MSDNDVLSKDEVGALLTGVEDGVVPTNSGVEPTGEVTTFEFTSSSNVSSFCPASLVNIYTRAARHLQLELYSMLKRDVMVELNTVRKHRYDEYIATLDDPICLHTITEESLPGTALVVMEAGLVYDFVHHYFGGAGETVESHHQGERNITPSEAVISRKLLDLLLDKLVLAWSDVVKLSFSFCGFETDPGMVTIAAPSTSMLVAKFDINLAEATNSCHVVMPLNMLKPVRPLLEASGQGSLAKREQFRAAMRQALKNVNVDLRSTICTLHLSLRELLSLSPGDVIPVDLPSNIELCVDTESVLFGRYGRSRGANALSIAGRASQSENTHTNEATP